jgi:hypothetical protein
MEVQFYDYYEQKNHVEIGKNSTVQKNKTNKSCKPNQKSHIIHAAAEMQSLLFSCLFTKQKIKALFTKQKAKVCLQNKNQSFVYKTNQNNLFTNQLLSILSSIHRLHKSFIVGIQRNQNFQLVVAPKPAKKICKTKNPHDF